MITIPFGKHQGKRLDDLQAKEPAYVEWLMEQGWVEEKFPEIFHYFETGELLVIEGPEQPYKSEASHDLNQTDAITDIMVDLETLGTRSGDVVLNVTAVAFNISTGEIGSEFQVDIDLKDSLESGFTIEAGTLKWWLSTNSSLLEEILSDGVDSVTSAMLKISKWLSQYSETRIWGNSNRMDLGLLAAYFDKINMEYPWKYYNERDVRTLVSMAPHIKEEEKFVGTKHNPLDDCIHQIKYCSKIWNLINQENA